MKFCAISDLHGILYLYDLSEKIKDADILLIAGDTVDMWSQKSMKLSKEWYEEEFIPWTKEINCKHIVMIGGNHDEKMSAMQPHDAGCRRLLPILRCKGGSASEEKQQTTIYRADLPDRRDARGSGLADGAAFEQRK